ncbi:MAG: hypothetical protein IKM06_02695 [Clostridia bacterium]|nr:hypothetical protein [Clostridia bacterium]
MDGTEEMINERVIIPEDFIPFKRFDYKGRIYALFITAAKSIDEDHGCYCFEQIDEKYYTISVEDFEPLANYVYYLYSGRRIYNQEINFADFQLLFPPRRN